MPVTAAVGLGLVASELAKGSLVPSQCRWCDRDAWGNDTLSGVDEGVRGALKWGDTKPARLASDVTVYGVLPAAALGVSLLAAAQDGHPKEVLEDGLVIVESSVMALGLTQMVKFAIARERPFVHARTPEARERLREPDDDLSFFSGHTSLAFALYTSTATVATLRGRKLAPWIWGIGAPLAVLPGYLRIAGDKHYFTDVAVGGAIGAAFGVAVPLLFHRAEPRHEPSPASPLVRSASFVPSPGGGVFLLRGAF